MSENVVPLPGHFIPERGKPVDTVIELLEELLAMAKRGEIVGVNVATVTDDGTPAREIDSSCAFRVGECWSLVAAQTLATRELHKVAFDAE